MHARVLASQAAPATVVHRQQNASHREVQTIGSVVWQKQMLQHLLLQLRLLLLLLMLLWKVLLQWQQ